MKKWQESSPKISESTPNEISIYKGEITTPCVIKNIAKIKAAFPALPKEFYKIISERIVDNGFNDERLTDAVNHVIDTCPYPSPTIAQFISFDRKVKLNTYEDMLKKTSEFGPEIWNSYKQVMLPKRTKPVWVLIDEAKIFNL